MSVIGLDSRASTTDYGTFPLSLATTVDVGFQEPWGSGMVIGSNHVLTAGHVGFNSRIGGQIQPLRVVLSSDEDALNSRRIGDGADPAANVTNWNFLKGYDNGAAREDDILLLTTSTSFVQPDEAIGLIAFVDPADAQGLTIDLAGYPGDINNGRDLVSAPDGTVTGTRDNGRLFYEIDTAAGQSGSGIWHTLDGDDFDRVLGVHTHGTGQNRFIAALPFVGRDNGGTLITEDVYYGIADQMAGDIGTNLPQIAASLPENAIVGSSVGDVVLATWREERILGADGNDRLAGGGADDRLEGGNGTDQALFGDVIGNYDIAITDPNAPTFTIEHVGGSQADGTDVLQSIEFAVFEFDDADAFGTAGYGDDDDGELFFVPLQVDPDDASKLKDGPLLDPNVANVDVVDTAGDPIGTLSIEIPAFMFDGDVDYTLTLGSQGGTLFNFAYIVDSSGSMTGANIAETKAAYGALTQSLIDQSVAARSNFAVIDFDSSATLFPDLTAAEATSRVNALVAGGGTRFAPALERAETWFESLGNVASATNIAYFLSDGFGSGASPDLQTVNEGLADETTVDVRAFGIGGGADLSSLNQIDSGNAVLLTNAADLTDAFSVSGIDRNIIERIDVKVNGTVVESIAPSALVDAPLGLTLEGSIDNLEVSRTAENDVSFDVVFNDGTPTANLAVKITTGQDEVRSQTADGTRQVVTFSVVQSDYVGGNESAIVNANDLGNTIRIVDGDNILRGNAGDDLFIIDGGSNVINGGSGLDIAVFDGLAADFGGVSRTGSLLTVGGNNTLIDIEYVQFDDSLIETTNLRETAQLTLQSDILDVTEDAATAEVVVRLANPLARAVTINFATRDGNAAAGADFVAAMQDATIAAGATETRFVVDLTKDGLAEGDERFFVDATVTGDALFSNNKQTATAEITIRDNDTLISVSADESAGDIVEGSGNTPPHIVTIERFGDLSGMDRVEITTRPGATAPVDADDFVNGLPSGTVTFAAGESLKTFAIGVEGDTIIEPDEQFELALRPLSGSGKVLTENTFFTVIDDDSPNDLIEGVVSEIIGTNSADTLDGNSRDNVIDALGGDDVVRPRTGADEITLGDGADRLEGAPADFYGDTIADFTGEDEIVFTDFAATRDNFTVTAGSAVIAVDEDDDGSDEGSFTLEGDFSGGDFMAVADGLDTVMTFESFLPELARGQAVDPDLVNGIINERFFRGDGSTDFRITLQDVGFAGYDNVVGVYEVDGGGTILDPRILFANANADKTAEAVVEDVDDGHQIGFFLVQDAASWAAGIAPGDVLSFVDENDAPATIDTVDAIALALNGTTVDETVFHSVSGALNPDGIEHALSGVAPAGKAISVGFEDLTGGGDRDYEDVVFNVEAVDGGTII